ncbi:MAG: hypothetical protein ABIS18_03090 [Actinomycetota bacterium]
MKTWLLAALTASTLVGLPSPASGAVALVGTIVNGTAGGAIPANAQVSAAQLTSSGKETQRLTATATDGMFRIDGFDGNGSRYVVATTYQQITYSTVIDVAASTELKVELKVFETTRDTLVISVESDSVTIIEGKDGAFEVLQLMRLSNSSDRTYIGQAQDDAPSVVNLPVAVAGFDVSAGEGITADRVSTYPDGIVSADPLQPGATNFSYSYKLRAPRNGLLLQRATSYPTKHVDVLIGPGLQLQSPALTFKEQKTFGGKTFRRFRAEGPAAGNLLEANIAHASKPTSSIWVGLAILGAIGLLGLIFGSRRRLAMKVTAQDRQAMIDQIALLDERFASGDLSEDEHKRQRLGLKEGLVRATEQLVK